MDSKQRNNISKNKYKNSFIEITASCGSGKSYGLCNEIMKLYLKQLENSKKVKNIK